MSNRTPDGQEINLPAMLARAEMISALESGMHKQCFGTVGAPTLSTSPVCWYGLALRIWHIQEDGNSFYTIATKMGMTYQEASELVCLNDNRCTFKTLANSMRHMPPAVVGKKYDTEDTSF